MSALALTSSLLSQSFESNTFGVAHARIASVRLVPECMTPVVVECRPAEFASVVAAVGHEEDTRAAVGSANGGRRENSPFSSEPERGQVSENVAPSSNKVACDIFTDEDAGSHHAKQSRDFGPEPSGVGLDESSSGLRDWLTGPSSAHEIDGLELGSNAAHVVEPSHVGPVSGEDALAELVSLDLPSRLESEPLDGAVESADPGEEAAVARHLTPPPASSGGAPRAAHS